MHCYSKRQDLRAHIISHLGDNLCRCGSHVRIGAEGRVTCMMGKVELGQGSKKALAQILAEELDVALDSVDMVMGDAGEARHLRATGRG